MSWNQLLNIIKENREALEEDRGDPPLVCPLDGELLDINERGTRNCPLGNYRWDGGPVRIPQQ